MIINLQTYCCSDHLFVWYTTDLHGNLGWSKTNDNFGVVLEALRREHQGVTTGKGGMCGPLDASITTITVTSSDAGSDIYLGDM